ncbi:MAG: ATP-binding protein [Fibrobacteria bacterium]|nr:ATP-binding protein [Fibrobacteria bacterium]
METNPFSYTKIVSGKAFCNRKKELKDLSVYILGNQNVVLYSNRRMGKSSLLLKTAEKLKNQRKFLYVDLYGTISETDFISAIFKALKQLELNLDRLFKLLKGTFTSLSLTVSMDPTTATPTISPNFIPSQKEKFLDEAFSAIYTLSKKKDLCVVFDEFQEVADYAEPDFEKRLRRIIQIHDNTSYVFSGSKRHILLRMFSENNQAFYRQAEPYELLDIEKKHYLKWVKEMFGPKGTPLEEEFISSIIDACECHPMYVQRFLFHLWEKKDPQAIDINVILELLIQRHEGEFQTLWDSLTLNQKKVMKLILKCGGVNIFSAENIQGVQLQTASQVKKAADALLTAGIVDKTNVYHIQDLLLKNWLFRKL